MRRSLYGSAAAGAMVVVVAALLGLQAPARPGAAGAPATALAAAHPSLATEASLARSRLALNLRQAHPGHAEAVIHPGRDHLGSTGVAAVARAGVARPATAPARPMPLGVDVSSIQGNVDWEAVIGAGDTFAWVKATEGTYYADKTYFYGQYEGSYTAGMIRGAYHFAIPSNSTGAAQADYFVANGGGWSADGRTLPGMLDLENNPYGKSECYGLTQKDMVAWVRSFDNEYHRLTGRYPALYTNASFWNTCTGGSSVAAADPLDLAAWGPSASPVPGGWASATTWQYTDHNSLGFDGDKYLGTATGLESFALDPGVTLPPTTTTTVPCATTTTTSTTTSSTTTPSTTTSSTTTTTGGTTTSTTTASTTTTTAAPTTTTTTPACPTTTTTRPDPTTTTTTTTTTTVPPPPPNRLASGEVLARGQRILSGNGRFELLMQRDGNLVLYVVHGRALWQSRTFRHPGAVAAITSAGNLEVESPGGAPLWQTHIKRTGPTYAVMQDDANLVLYRAGRKPVWASHTAGR